MARPSVVEWNVGGGKTKCRVSEPATQQSAVAVPVLDGAEEMFDGSCPLPHGIGDGGETFAGAFEGFTMDADEELAEGAFGALLPCEARSAGGVVIIGAEAAAGVVVFGVGLAGQDFTLGAGVGVVDRIVGAGVGIVKAVGLAGCFLNRGPRRWFHGLRRRRAGGRCCSRCRRER